MSLIAENLAHIRARVEAAACAVGRSKDSVAIVAVSKTHPASAIREAYAAGQRDFGENYAQELRDKARELSDLAQLRWHFIGHLQRNKVKYVVPCAALMETVDSATLAEELERGAATLGRTLDCLVQVNVGGEEQKSGCDPAQVESILATVERAAHLRLRGLMTIPPFELEADQTRHYFEAMRELASRCGGPARLPHLSMGMSHDFEVAIAQGATLVRVGTAIFGER